MKKIMAFLLALSMLFVLTACGGSEAPAAQAPAEAPATQAPAAEAGEAAPAELTGTLRVSAQAWMMNKYDWASMEKNFEANHPGVDVVISQVEDSEITSYMLQWSQGSTDCGLVFGNDRGMIAALCANDFVTPLGDEFFSDIKKEDYFQAFLELGNIDGTQYMIPVCCEVVGISCNLKAFEEAGLLNADGSLPQPATWEELADIAAKLEAAGYTGLSIDWGTNMMQYSYITALQGVAGTIFEEGTNLMDFTSDDAKYVLETWKGLVDSGLSPTDTFADANAGRTNFKAGTVGMLLAPASCWIECQTELGEGNVGLMLVPGTDVNGTCAFIHGAYVCSLAPENEQELAKLFIKEELLREEILVAGMNAYGKMSPLMKHYNDSLVDPYWDACVEASVNGVAPPVYKDYNKLNLNMISEIQSYLVGEISLEDCLGGLADMVHTIDTSSGLN